MTLKSPVFGIVAGEASGDTLGADLIRALKVQYPQARFIGIAGPQMLAEGAETLVPMERLSVMGLVEVLGRLRELFGIRDQLIAHLLAQKIDVFIGIDAPDFNLRIAAELKAKGLRTVHYVSPSVWAWRQGRVHGIRASVDLMLCLLPFEKAFYDQHAVDAVFVGHPLADSLPMLNDTQAARQRLGIGGGEWLALLPGSRRGEVASMLPLLLDAAQRIHAQRPGCQFMIPAINAERRADIDALVAGYPELPIRVFDQQRGAGVGREVMAASDIVALTSGTATLEALLLKKPMVVTYRLHWLTWLIARFLVRIPFVSLPNLLAGRRLVPELLQGQANPDNIAKEVLAWLNDPVRISQTQSSFQQFHAQLAANASVTGARAISALLAKPVRVP
ncbi:lipid-A-disaccharide synthase [Paraperlucidibaca baekdonensis]|uniref:Lipid-A-disaccharide synthase n=1 Tax=Paraperlucidibaca baekdonensis TaxID=748120 RepID=A0A3E0H5L4_9GAMM|nr:lipid-A-disaccharide synthase [Paraperlucidibaca baekdonensis]REH37900.1 lipid-A-disaccharide synthase [Paraperlucidibaca baekdonensis]